MRTRPLLPALAIAMAALTLSSARAFAQPPVPLPPSVPIPATEKVWTETASVGYALTSGNKDTSTLNVGYEVIYTPEGKNLIRSDGLYLRGKSEGFVNTERLVLNGRDEFRFHPRAFAFTQAQYVEDRFKNIDYLFASTGGLGLRVVDVPETKLSIDTGLGGVLEKNPGADLVVSGAVTYAEKFSHQLTQTTTITQALSALHKTGDFGDALFIFNSGISASLTSRTQMKVELLDTYKRRVPSTGVVKNDVALVVAFVYKN